MYIRVGAASDDGHNPPTKNKVPALSVAIDPGFCRSSWEAHHLQGSSGSSSSLLVLTQ